LDFDGAIVALPTVVAFAILEELRVACGVLCFAVFFSKIAGAAARTRAYIARLGADVSTRLGWIIKALGKCRTWQCSLRFRTGRRSARGVAPAFQTVTLACFNVADAAAPGIVDATSQSVEDGRLARSTGHTAGAR